MSSLVVALVGVLGVLLGVLLSHCLATYRERQKEIRASIAEFKDSFAQVLNALSDNEANPTLLVIESFPTHKEAAIKLIGKLPTRKAKVFGSAWTKYQDLYQKNASLGTVAMFASEVTDPSRALDSKHIYEVNSQRRNEAIGIIRKVLVALDR